MFLRDKIRFIILKNFFLRELFFLCGRRKVSLGRIEKKIKRLKEKDFQKKEVIPKLVVSLTSYGERISELKYVLYSLVSQSIRPEKIIVNIAYSDKQLINSEVRFFEKFGIEFFFCEDIRSYKKLIPTLQRYPDYCIVTADDDLYYKKDWLERLYLTHIQYPNEVCCHLVHEITYKKDMINPYQKWVHNVKGCNDKNIFFPLSGGGCLYPPLSFYQDIQNKNLFLSLSPYADDIWFYFMVILNNRKIRQVKNPYIRFRYVNPYREYRISSNQTLTQKNVTEGMNDVQFRAVLKYYKITEKEFIDYITGDSLLSF